MSKFDPTFQPYVVRRHGNHFAIVLRADKTKIHFVERRTTKLGMSSLTRNQFYKVWYRYDEADFLAAVESFLSHRAGIHRGAKQALLAAAETYYLFT